MVFVRFGGKLGKAQIFGAAAPSPRGYIAWRPRVFLYLCILLTTTTTMMMMTMMMSAAQWTAAGQRGRHGRHAV